MKALYFAYGLSLEEYEMTTRTPSARFYKFAVIKDFTLVFNGHANLVPEKGAYTEGVLYTIEHTELEPPREGSSLSPLDILTDSGELVSAYTYTRPSASNPVSPTEEYVSRMRKKYLDYGFNTKHIERALGLL